MILTMFEVNFGEAILMTEEDYQLLVDCGAKFGGKGKTAAAAVQGQLTQIHKTALVTHFDEDHYNGLIELAGKVQLDHIYLPRYKYSRGDGVEETEGYLNQVVTIWSYQRLIRQNKKLDALQRLMISLTRLVGSRDQVSCVAKGDQVNCGPKVWNVLWPETKDSSLRRYVQELEDIVGRCTGERWQQVQQTVNRYTQALVAVYAIYAERHNDYSFGTLNQAEYQELEESYQQLIQLSVDVVIDPADNKRMNGIFQSVIRSMNNSSVVLECPGETLFLGDIGKEIYKRHIQPHLTDGYKVVKVSHHGTKNYYTPDLPEAKVYLVSNSGIWRTDWGIYEEYRKNYPEQMQCTNTEAQRCVAKLPVCTQCRMSQAKVLANGNRVIDVDKL